MKVKEAMIINPVVVNPDVLIRQAAKMMKNDEIGSVIVVRNNELVGILTERDLVRKVLAGDRNPDHIKVSEVMSSPVLCVSENSDLLEASKLMERNKIGRLVVIDDTYQIVGIITTNDMEKTLSVRVHDYLVRA
jgi:CBS domain-containing protein